MESWRDGLANLLTRLASEPWTASLQEQLQVAADELSRRAAAMAGEAEGVAGFETKTIGVLAFPGLNREKLLSLIKDDQPAEFWPAESPAGCCPLVFVK